MKAISLALRLPIYKLYKYVELPGVMPFSYVLLLSTRCNSHCKTCNLWTQEPKAELSVEQWLRIIESIGNTAAWVTVTGGEPFMIKDIDTLLAAIIQNINPEVICIPTNGTLPRLMKNKLGHVLRLRSGTQFIINISLDELGKRHDELRGFKGNFQKLKQSVAELKQLQKSYKNLKIGINTVISKANINRLYDIYSYVVQKLKPDDYIFETAQSRQELGTAARKFEFSQSKLEAFLKFLVKSQKAQKKHGISAFKAKSRLKYYASITDNTKKRCNAGILSCEIMPDGEVVNCGVKATALGNLSRFGYDIKALWKAAAPRRNQLRKQRCNCQLANIFYINRI